MDFQEFLKECWGCHKGKKKLQFGGNLHTHPDSGIVLKILVCLCKIGFCMSDPRVMAEVCALQVSLPVVRDVLTSHLQLLLQHRDLKCTQWLQYQHKNVWAGPQPDISAWSGSPSYGLYLNISSDVWLSGLWAPQESHIYIYPGKVLSWVLQHVQDDYCVVEAILFHFHI